MYSKEFPPNNGDRVSFKIGAKSHTGRVIGYDDNDVVIRRSFEVDSFAAKIVRRPWADVIFLKTCPWYKFWQRSR